MRNQMKQGFKRIVNFILIAAAIGALIFEINLFVNAQSAPPATPLSGAVKAQDDTSKCSAGMQKLIAYKQREFATFMNDTFRQPRPTSELIGEAILRLRQYKNDLNAQIAKISPQDKKEFGASIEEFQKCQSLIDADFKNMTEFVRQHIVETAYAKKTTLLLEKYKEINERLSKLNFTIGQMYAYFGSFAQQIACFATKCTKG